MIAESVISKVKKQNHMLPTRQIALSFLGVIFVGSLLLSLPIANAKTSTSYINHLFIAVSATCVTGLVTVVPAQQYTLFGQIVIMIMIQIGGLGFLTFLYILLIKIKRKLTLNSKIVLQEALNQSSMNKLPHFIKKVLCFTFGVEAIGAILLSSQFISRYGWIKGIYFGIFHSVSAFCNAGFDVLGSQSMMPYQNNMIVNLTIDFLIVAGGLGFIVWFDLADKIKKYFKCRHQNRRPLFKTLTVHSKIVLTMTSFLIVFAAVVFFLCEMNNPKTIGNLSPFDQFLASLFQSITLRTAGFASVPMDCLNDATKLMMSIVMFIGGSPAGTAGGIKTVVFAIAILLVYHVYCGRKEITVFSRRIPKHVILRAFTIMFISLMITFVGIFILSISEQAPFIDIVFECVSAFATVGLSASLTPQLTIVGKIVIMILMFIGRIGPITMVISFARKSNMHDGKKEIMYSDGHILLG
ncbi:MULTISPECIES: TrkH family potassium uptake protein [Coprobacillaceae]|uniref:TrkH family potassium uptake protein n=1 Tax=Coprobacillaceae TaxID=2810280 RepID=UPI000E49F9C7|nr:MULTISPECIES: TrkH family potassium uptake protein [Coprobacillaceae]RHM62846.1 potassium uptake protein [Coprobacillus sp. AF33-1AC]RHS95015.1 potassium uptake protein [Erysipelatoclostridium sp. AM42-17]